MGNRLAEWTKGQPLGIGGYIGVTNPFAVYDGNTAGLRLFPQTDAALIVRAHTLGKSHTESITALERKISHYLDDSRLRKLNEE